MPPTSTTPGLVCARRRSSRHDVSGVPPPGSAAALGRDGLAQAGAQGSHSPARPRRAGGGVRPRAPPRGGVRPRAPPLAGGWVGRGAEVECGSGSAQRLAGAEAGGGGIVRTAGLSSRGAGARALPLLSRPGCSARGGLSLPASRSSARGADSGHPPAPSRPPAASTAAAALAPMALCNGDSKVSVAGVPASRGSRRRPRSGGSGGPRAPSRPSSPGRPRVPGSGASQSSPAGACGVFSAQQRRRFVDFCLCVEVRASGRVQLAAGGRGAGGRGWARGGGLARTPLGTSGRRGPAAETPGPRKQGWPAAGRAALGPSRPVVCPPAPDEARGAPSHARWRPAAVLGEARGRLSRSGRGLWPRAVVGLPSAGPAGHGRAPWARPVPRAASAPSPPGSGVPGCWGSGRGERGLGRAACGLQLALACRLLVFRPACELRPHSLHCHLKFRWHRVLSDFPQNHSILSAGVCGFQLSFT